MTDEATASMSMRLVQQSTLSRSTRRVHAYVVLALTGEASARADARAEVVVLDRSSSMEQPAEKLRAAKDAICSTVASIEDGVSFAVVAGHHTACAIYPASGMAVADATTRRHAARAVRGVRAVGGTAIGSWLTLARELLTAAGTTTRHVLLLTDGKNEHEPPEKLTEVLDQCEGTFVCDALGVGDDYDPHEVLRIAAVLRGAARGIPRPDQLDEHLRDLAMKSRGALVRDVVLSVTTLPFTRLVALRQVVPRTVDLTDRLRHVSPRRSDLSTGAWAIGDVKEYFLTFDIDADRQPPLGTEVALAEFSLGPVDDVSVPDDPEALIGRWVDEDVSAPSDPTAQAFLQHTELHEAFERGYAELGKGDRDAAAQHWATARRLAVETGNHRMTQQLDRLVQPTGEDGSVRLRADLDASEVLEVLIGSSEYPGAAHPLVPDEDRPAPVLDVPCPACGVPGRGPGWFCGACGERHEPEVAS